MGHHYGYFLFAFLTSYKVAFREGEKKKITTRAIVEPSERLGAHPAPNMPVDSQQPQQSARLAKSLATLPAGMLMANSSQCRADSHRQSPINAQCLGFIPLVLSSGASSKSNISTK